jgi:hypothetical protein
LFRQFLNYLPNELAQTFKLCVCLCIFRLRCDTTNFTSAGGSFFAIDSVLSKKKKQSSLCFCGIWEASGSGILFCFAKRSKV